MSTVFEEFLRKSKPLFVAVGAAGLLATTACSSDVQRFGQVGGTSSPQAMSPSSVAATPLEPLPASNIQTGVGNRRYAEVQPNASSSRSAPGGGSIRVGTGDTLYSLARDNGVTVEELAAYNGIQFPYHVRFGQTLRIPGGGNSPTVAAYAPTNRSAPTGGSHTVQPGETLYSVSRRYNVDVKDLAYANGLSMQTGLQIGQKLKLPDGSTASRRQAAAATTPKPAPAAQPKAVVAATPQPEPREVEVASTAPDAVVTQLSQPPARTSAMFRWPVRGRLVARFGPQSDGSRNDGVDISVPEGTSVKAAEEGVVAYSGNELKGYGNLVLIRHADDWVTAYAHNSEILVGRGDTVKRGQIIAKAGKSGSVSKPQVHFEVRKGAKAVDPLSYLEGA